MLNHITLICLGYSQQVEIFEKSQKRGDSDFLLKIGGSTYWGLPIEGGGGHCLLFEVYEFRSNNAIYLARFSFTMFIFLLTPIDFQSGVAYKGVAYKKPCKLVLYSSQHEERTLPHERGGGGEEELAIQRGVCVYRRGASNLVYSNSLESVIKTLGASGKNQSHSAIELNLGKNSTFYIFPCHCAASMVHY